MKRGVRGTLSYIAVIVLPIAVLGLRNSVDAIIRWLAGGAAYGGWPLSMVYVMMYVCGALFFSIVGFNLFIVAILPTSRRSAVILIAVTILLAVVLVFWLFPPYAFSAIRRVVGRPSLIGAYLAFYGLSFARQLRTGRNAPRHSEVVEALARIAVIVLPIVVVGFQMMYNAGYHRLLYSDDLVGTSLLPDQLLYGWSVLTFGMIGLNLFVTAVLPTSRQNAIVLIAAGILVVAIFTCYLCLCLFPAMRGLIQDPSWMGVYLAFYGLSCKRQLTARRDKSGDSGEMMPGSRPTVSL